MIRQLFYIFKSRGLIGLIIFCSKEVRYKVINPIFYNSHSQKGEDLLINGLLDNKNKGFYIDIGAYHPKKLSNTKFFYDLGWTGINIEPNPTQFRLFIESRPRDINMNIGIGKTSGKMTYYEIYPLGLSTFSKIHADNYQQHGYKITRKLKINIEPLSKITSKTNKPIDFLSVDTEGLDLAVLQSNNWKKNRPKIICIETEEHLELIKNNKKNPNKFDNYLQSIGYQPKYHTDLNTIYLDIKWKKKIH